MVRPLFGCLMLGLVACAGRGGRVASVPIESGMALADRATYAVHVESRLGDVRVLVDPKLLRPVVWASARGGEGRVVAPAWVAAAIDESPVTPVLRVLAANPEPGAARADLRIRVPACSGVTVHTAGGSVEVRGVSGAVDVRNGTDFEAGGSVGVSFAEAVQWPMSVRSAGGPVAIDLPSGSRGMIDAGASAGRVRVQGGEGQLRGVVDRGSGWRGTLGAGDNPLTIRAGAGDVTIRVRP